MQASFGSLINYQIATIREKCSQKHLPFQQTINDVINTAILYPQINNWNYMLFYVIKLCQYSGKLHPNFLWYFYNIDFQNIFRNLQIQTSFLVSQTC